MIRARSFFRAYFALWLLALFGALCFCAGVAVTTVMAVQMIEAAR